MVGWNIIGDCGSDSLIVGISRSLRKKIMETKRLFKSILSWGGVGLMALGFLSVSLCPIWWVAWVLFVPGTLSLCAGVVWSMVDDVDPEPKK